MSVEFARSGVDRPARVPCSTATPPELPILFMALQKSLHGLGVAVVVVVVMMVVGVVVVVVVVVVVLVLVVLVVLVMVVLVVVHVYGHLAP